MTSDPTALPLERVEAEICTLAGQIAAATSRFLCLLSDFDAREGWAGWGMRSCAHWLSWRCGLDLRTAREQVRVARALTDLPRISDAFSQGRLSYSKVRALSRVARRDTEDDLLDAALHATAAQVERLVRGLQTAEHLADDEQSATGPASSGDQSADRLGVRWRWTDDGDLVIWGRLGPEDGTRLLAGLTRIAQDGERTDQEPSTTQESDGSAEHPPGRDGSAEHHRDRDGSAEPSRAPSIDPGALSDLAPALVAAAELLCTSVQAPIHAPAADVVVHVDVDTLVATARRAANGHFATPVSTRCARIDDGPGLVHSTLQRLACDARLQLSVDGSDGQTLDLGRRSRRPSQRQLTALWRRDRGRAMPGCDRTRFLHAHHVRAWALGGSTDLDNLILLCGEHHRQLHDGGFFIVALGDQRFRFHGSQGAERPQAPHVEGNASALADKYPDVEPTTIEPDWDGSALHLHDAVATYLARWAKQSVD